MLSCCRPETPAQPPNSTLILRLSFLALSAGRGLPHVRCAGNGRILLANPSVPKLVCSICLLGRQKKLRKLPQEKVLPRTLKEVNEMDPPLCGAIVIRQNGERGRHHH